ncbi:Minor extracellular protease vpr [bacterium HR08]|nr:Minor extracellular protease vpr [bacterium HR08]
MKWSRWIGSALVGIGVLVNPLWGTSLQGRSSQVPTFPETLTVEGKKAYLVIFHELPLVQYEGGIRGLAATSLRVAPQNRRDGKLDLQSPASANYLSYLEARQTTFTERLRQRVPEAQWGYAYRIVLNGVAALIPEDQVEEVARWPEVARLAPIRPNQLFAGGAAPPPLDVSNPLMGAPALWEAVGGPENAGRGIKIGIIDSGVDFSNPMFHDPTLVPPPGFPKGDLTLANSKVIVAKVIPSLQDLNNKNVNPGHFTAQDLVGHGTHVAAVAAGNVVDLRGTPGARPVTLSGVAPKAFIGSYRVFAPNAATDNVVKAIEEAVADGMDVINISFGSISLGSQEEPDPQVEAVENAVAAGVIVCVAAGNFGPDRATITSPGTAPSAITVGAVTNAHDGFTPGQLRVVQVTSPEPPANFVRIVGVRANRFPDSLVVPVVDADLLDNGRLDGGGYGCNPLPSALVRDRALLVQRGDCLILTKAFNAWVSGAAALIIYNNQEAGDVIDAVPLAGQFLPTLFLPRSSGLALKNLVATNATNGRETVIALTPASEPLVFERQPHVLLEQSSRGPTPTRLLLIKPDLVTIGGGSYGPAQDDDPRGENRFPRPDPGSLQPTLYDPSGYVFTSGTSFAAPRVAGAAALLKQLHPDWSPAEIKAALMTTAARPTGPNEVGLARIMDRGAGLVDLDAARRVLTLVTPPSHSFGSVIVGTPTTLIREFVIKNRAQSAVTYTIQAALSPPAPSFLKVDVSPTQLTVPAGGTGTFTLKLTIDAGSITSRIDSEGFVLIADGEPTTPRPLYVPFWIRTAPR